MPAAGAVDKGLPYPAMVGSKEALLQIHPQHWQDVVPATFPGQVTPEQPIRWIHHAFDVDFSRQMRALIGHRVNADGVFKKPKSAQVYQPGKIASLSNFAAKPTWVESREVSASPVILVAHQNAQKLRRRRNHDKVFAAQLAALQ